MPAIGQVTRPLLHFPVTPEMTTVLIRRRLQTDTSTRSARTIRCLTLLHVGYGGAARLLVREPSAGPMAGRLAFGSR